MTWRIISLAVGVMLTVGLAMLDVSWPWLVLSGATDAWALWAIARDAARGRQ